MTYLKGIISLLLVLLSGPLYLLLTHQVDFSTTWRQAFNGSAHMAPLPQQHPEAIIQVYSARAFNWRGLFSEHVWFAIKPAHAQQYTTYQVIGWYLLRKKPALVIRQDLPDRYWFGNKPYLVYSLTGPKAQALIPKLEAAIDNYRYKEEYQAWPGPNSNTFVATVARQVPALRLALPAAALGQDYLGATTFFARAPSGTGYQFSLFGILGFTLAEAEGLRVNLLGLTLGINFKPLRLIYPAIGLVP